MFDMAIPRVDTIMFGNGNRLISVDPVLFPVVIDFNLAVSYVLGVLGSFDDSIVSIGSGSRGEPFSTFRIHSQRWRIAKGKRLYKRRSPFAKVFVPRILNSTLCA